MSPASYLDGHKHPPTFIAYSRAEGRDDQSKALPNACAPSALK
ncbi:MULTISPECIES: hypothetical protein [unclassified Mesorhizobium]|nr:MULTISPECIES: hypothetical protein [unclassified Mesorhizobium]ESW80041.1 hypothetical protein X773_16990 [Mesorhizobium sp. LSJC285A00]ESW93889.1 hypothetical protein X770_04630 [Mesorhizobium sp. LSJC269B00]ESX15641.1 hypothetical protein X766_25390 [Mesorhizobium sp. LSJC255A00]ESX23032.1 hypothetical protein X767_17205 [Mesorhizobium sp. LSJC264A00]ESX32820.1 hypothetical protein X765_01195 [Mesorhizobium sp. LSHC440B00]ESX45010.1 hypothetical protein X764_06270 [Mesorhizobium sp. LSHC